MSVENLQQAFEEIEETNSCESNEKHGLLFCQIILITWLRSQFTKETKNLRFNIKTLI